MLAVLVLVALLVGVVVVVRWARSGATPQPLGAGSAPAVPTTPTGDPSTPAQEIVAENSKASDASWAIADEMLADPGQLAGYTAVSSALPGEGVELKLRSALGPVTVSAVRTGSYGGVGGRVVWTSDPVTVAAQPEPRLDPGRTVVANWSTALTLDTKDWPPGAYLLTLRAGGQGSYVPLTLRTPSANGRLVLVNPTATWQAYNEFGGFSLYKGADGQAHATAVSFDRPYHNNALHFRLDEYPYVKLAEGAGLPMAYITSEDLETPGILDGALGVVSGGHDEYWSVPMRDAVERARDAGVNVAFLGGNEIYWRVRFADDRRTVVGYRDLAAQDPEQGPTTTALWRANPHARPEHTLTGQLYECYPVQGDWVVTTPDWFGYAGTGVSAGSRIADVVGVESNRAYPVEGTPDTLQVVALAPVSCGQGQSVHTGTYYTAPSGAGVFAVGTINWANLAGGTAGEPAAQTFVKQVTVNVLTAMAAGPMGTQHPATPNIGDFSLNPSSTTGTGGPAVIGSR